MVSNDVEQRRQAKPIQSIIRVEFECMQTSKRLEDISLVDNQNNNDNWLTEEEDIDEQMRDRKNE